jgi:4-carboxymuconolactone decarboxylase
VTDRYDDGMRVRRAVLGDAHVDRSEAGADDFTRDFQRFITETAWGSVWSRPGLDRKTRSMVTIALLAALGRYEELQLHVRATVNTGVSKSEVSELLMHAAVYAGIPAANSAFAHAAQAYAALANDSKLKETDR